MTNPEPWRFRMPDSVCGHHTWYIRQYKTREEKERERRFVCHYCGSVSNEIYDKREDELRVGLV